MRPFGMIEECTTVGQVLGTLFAAASVIEFGERAFEFRDFHNEGRPRFVGEFRGSRMAFTQIAGESGRQIVQVLRTRRAQLQIRAGEGVERFDADELDKAREFSAQAIAETSPIGTSVDLKTLLS